MSADNLVDAARVRQALLYALDRQKMVNSPAIFNKQAVVAESVMLPVWWAYNKDTTPKYPYDPTKAAQLLDARLGPQKQVEAALEHLLLWSVRGGGIAVFVGLARQEQRLELAVQPLAGRQPRLGKRHRKCGADADPGVHHGGWAC